MLPNDLNQQMIDDYAAMTHDPVACAAYSFPWGEGSLEKYEGPKMWQSRILQDIKDHYSDPANKYVPLQIAVASGHSIGKSALLSMVCHWGISTHEDCRIVVTANTDTQLRTKTWPEVTKWFRLAMNEDWFNPTATAVISTDKQHEKSWRADAIPWSVSNTEAFAGLHNKGKRIILIFDEASAIDDKIWEVTDGILTDDDTEIIWLAFGNPTRCDGRFYDCFHKFRHRWKTYQIDAREVEGTNKEKIQQMVDDYGEDSDYVKVRVRGVFPSASPNQIISREMVDACFEYTAIEYDWAAIVFGIDFARSGLCQNVVVVRQGRKVLDIIRWHSMDSMFTAGKIVEVYNQYRPDALLCDEGGLGGPIIDRLRQLLPKEKVFGINSSNNASKPTRYHNKRAEMWWEAGLAIKDKVDIDRDEELATDLTSVPYFFDGKNRIQLPKKEDLDFSPDSGDAFALTYAMNIVRDKPVTVRKKQFARSGGGGWRG